MVGVVTKAGLSPARRRLVEVMQRLNHGRIEGVVVKDGDPVFSLPPRVVREVKFGVDMGPRPETTLEDFALKAQVRQFFDQIEGMGDGVVACIEVKNGLPFRMTIEEVMA